MKKEDGGHPILSEMKEMLKKSIRLATKMNDLALEFRRVGKPNREDVQGEIRKAIIHARETTESLERLRDAIKEQDRGDKELYELLDLTVALKKQFVDRLSELLIGSLETEHE